MVSWCGVGFAECIKGDCINGYGTATWADGTKFVGKYKDGKKNGLGTFMFASGDKYVGEFKDNKYHGQGTYTFADGEKYVGEFKNGKRHGYGIRTKGNTSYEGEWKEDMKHGMGISINWNKTQKFIGNFINNQQNGEGTLISIEPEYTVQGNFEKFSLIGEGQILLDGKSHKVILTDEKYTWKE